MTESTFRTPSAIGRLLWGTIAGNLAGLVLCMIAFVVGNQSPAIGRPIIVPSFFLIPMAIGLVSAKIWSPLDPGTGSIALWTFLSSLLSVGVGALVFREGAICLVILYPLLWACIVAGASLGRIIFRRKDRLNALALPAVALAVMAEPALRGSHPGVVTDEIVIAAPATKVWPHVLRFDTIPETPGYWLFKMGLPYPTRTTNGGNYVGADRACEFSGGAVFKEKVAELQPERLLTFDIIEQPPDPELIGHLDSSRGQFELRDNGDGTTTLIGRTWYSLHVRPAWYFDWWTHQIFREVHLRVMRNVKRLAEEQP